MTAIGPMEPCGHVPLGSKPRVPDVVTSLYPRLHPISLSVKLDARKQTISISLGIVEMLRVFVY